MHECKKVFKTNTIDNCTGKGYDRCYGDNTLTLELYFQDIDGVETYFDNWLTRQVSYCPFCGYQPERLNEKTPTGDAIV